VDGSSSILIITMSTGGGGVGRGGEGSRSIYTHSGLCAKKAWVPAGVLGAQRFGPPDLIAPSCWPHCVVAGLLFAGAASNTRVYTRGLTMMRARGYADRGAEEGGGGEGGRKRRIRWGKRADPHTVGPTRNRIDLSAGPDARGP